MTTTTPPPPTGLENTRLVDILQEYRASTGMNRLVVMNRLRYYMRVQEIYTLVDEIRTVWEEEDLNAIIGAGAPGLAYYAVLGQKARAQGLM